MADTRTGEDMVRDQARRAGLIAGALHRGEVWPTGTLVRWAGAKSRVTYRVTGHVLFGRLERGEILMEITPLTKGPGRSKMNVAMENMRRVTA